MALNLGKVSGLALNWLGGESPHAVAVLSLGAQSLAAAGAARGHDLLAAFGRHPGAKAVTALAHQFARLIGPFHGVISAARIKF
jgi:hypothetical protein